MSNGSLTLARAFEFKVSHGVSNIRKFYHHSQVLLTCALSVGQNLNIPLRARRRGMSSGSGWRRLRSKSSCATGSAQAAAIVSLVSLYGVAFLWPRKRIGAPDYLLPRLAVLAALWETPYWCTQMRAGLRTSLLVELRIPPNSTVLGPFPKASWLQYVSASGQHDRRRSEPERSSRERGGGGLVDMNEVEVQQSALASRTTSGTPVA